MGQAPGSALLIRQIGPYLENLELEIWTDGETVKAFKSIWRYCNQIKFLRLYRIDYDNFSLLYGLIDRLKKLQHLSLRTRDFSIDVENDLKFVQ